MSDKKPEKGGRSGRVVYWTVAAVCVPLGLMGRQLDVPWLANHLGGFFYVFFWSCLILGAFPRQRPGPSLVLFSPLRVGWSSCSSGTRRSSRASGRRVPEPCCSGRRFCGKTFPRTSSERWPPGHCQRLFSRDVRMSYRRFVE